MTTSRSPYSAFAQLLQNEGHNATPAEIQGFLAGRSCAGAGFDNDAWLNEAAQLLGGELSETLQAGLIGLQRMVQTELTGEDVALVLLLPDDDCSLSERAEAMGAWCESFLAGFGLAVGERTLSDEAQEVLEDFVSIAQVQDSLEESEDGEADYMEVMEYLRVAPMLLFTECASAADAANKPALH